MADGIAVEDIVADDIVVEGIVVEGIGRGNVAFVGDMMGLG